MIKLFYLSGENVVEAVQVYHQNHKLKRGPCFVKSVHNSVKKFEKTRCTCDRLRSGRSRVPVEVVAEMHNTMTTGPFHTTRSISRNLDVPKTTGL